MTTQQRHEIPRPEWSELFEAVTNTEAREKLRAELGKDGGEK